MSPKSTRCFKCSQAHSWNRKYGLSRKDYRNMMAQQGGSCAICQTPSNALCVDHNHATGEVRGLLCNGCNLGLGHLKDSVYNLASAIQYLDMNGSYEDLDEEDDLEPWQ